MSQDDSRDETPPTEPAWHQWVVVMDVTLRGTVVVSATSPDEARRKVLDLDGINKPWHTQDWEVEDWDAVKVYDRVRD